MRLHRLPLVLLVCFTLTLTGCSGAKLLYGQAHTPPQYAKAVLIHHNALGTQVADIIGDPTVSEGSKTKLRDAYRQTVCDSAERAQGTPTASCNRGPSYQLDEAVRTYEGLKNAENEAEITAAVERLVPLLTAIINATSGAK